MATSNINSQNSMASTTDDGTEEEEEEEAGMSLIDHLEELRWRILKSLIAIVVGGIVAFIFRAQIIQFLVLPLPIQASQVLHILHGKPLIVTGIAECFTRRGHSFLQDCTHAKRNMPCPSFSLASFFSWQASHWDTSYCASRCNG